LSLFKAAWEARRRRIVKNTASAPIAITATITSNHGKLSAC